MRAEHARRMIVPALLAIGFAGFAWTIAMRHPQEREVNKAHPTAPENPCSLLTSRLCRDSGTQSSACGLARREAAGFSEPRCERMLSRYSDVLHELEALDRGTRALMAPEQRIVHGSAPSIGSPSAALTLVEFCDFESPDCARASPLARVISNLYADRVRLIVRQYPSPTHPQAQLSAEASLAAHAQGKFWEYREVLFANPQDLSRPALERYAAAVELDLIPFRRALDAHAFADDVSADVRLGHDVQALERPTLFANGRRVAVPYGVSELAGLVEAELGRSITP